jgi:hypothetical protein
LTPGHREACCTGYGLEKPQSALATSIRLLATYGGSIFLVSLCIKINARENPGVESVSFFDLPTGYKLVFSRLKRALFGAYTVQ